MLASMSSRHQLAAFIVLFCVFFILCVFVSDRSRQFEDVSGCSRVQHVFLITCALKVCFHVNRTPCWFEFMQLLDQTVGGGRGEGGLSTLGTLGLLGATSHVFISGYVTTVWSLSITQSAERTVSLSPQEEETVLKAGPSGTSSAGGGTIRPS